MTVDSTASIRFFSIMGWLGRILLVGALASVAHGQAVLNFQDLTLGNYAPIPTNYGTALSPNLAGVNYRTFDFATGATVTNYLEFWNEGYGDLSKVAFASSNGYMAELSLVPAAGYGIRLLSFDMAGWPMQDLTNTVMRLIDGTGAVVLNYAAAGPVPIQGDNNGPEHSAFSPNIFSAGPIRLQWGTNWNVGVDNVRFEVVSLTAVPEPPTWILLSIGGAFLAWRAQRKHRRKALT